MPNFGDFNFGDDADFVDTDPVPDENIDETQQEELETSSDGEENDVANYPEPGDNDEFQSGEPTDFSINANPEEPSAQEDHSPPVVIDPKKENQEDPPIEDETPDDEEPEPELEDPEFEEPESQELEGISPVTEQEFFTDDELDLLIIELLEDDTDEEVSTLDTEDEEDEFEVLPILGFDEDLADDDQIPDVQGLEVFDALDITDYLESLDLADFIDDATLDSDLIEFQNPDALENYDGLF